MKKKVFGMIAVMALAGALAVGCGGNDKKETEPATTTEKTTEKETETKKETETETTTESETETETKKAE